jgi:hypothetical protein
MGGEIKSHPYNVSQETLRIQITAPQPPPPTHTKTNPTPPVLALFLFTQAARHCDGRCAAADSWVDIWGAGEEGGRRQWRTEGVALSEEDGVGRRKANNGVSTSAWNTARLG